MKFIYFAITLLLKGACSQLQSENPTSIKFSHTGITTKFIRPLCIFTKKPPIHLSNEQLSELKSMLGEEYITEQKKERFINMKYNIVVTDQRTFSLLNKYFLANKEFYTNEKRRNNDDLMQSIAITIDDKITFEVYYRLRNHFFDKFGDYLKNKKCDSTVVRAISDLN